MVLLILGAAWFMGIAVTQGEARVGAIIFPPYAWYKAIEYLIVHLI